MEMADIQKLEERLESVLPLFREVQDAAFALLASGTMKAQCDYAEHFPRSRRRQKWQTDFFRQSKAELLLEGVVIMAKAKILKIPARGDWQFVEVDTDADGNLTLETMQSMVGGDIERWCLSGNGLDGLDLFLDEEGKLKERSYNPIATILAEILFHNDVIVGDTFVCAHDEEGNSIGLSDTQELALRRRLSDIGF